MRNSAGRRAFYSLAYVMLFLLGISFFPLQARATAYEESVDKNVVNDITPVEPAGSDLQVVHTVTKLASKRWIQSYTYDSQYYYYIQMTNPKKGNLRITRVKYNGLGRYTRDYMNLKYFGHATNLDCSVYNGKTYLWTGSNAASGSDVSRAITCFPYKKGKTLYRHGTYTYKIRKGSRGKYVTNVYPAINESSTKLAVRYTSNGQQYYQTYKLTRGTKINPKKPIRRVALPRTAGDFQGFDFYGGDFIFTIEGSPSRTFLAAYDKHRKYQPTIIRTWNLLSRTGTARTIKGAQALSFREPEGIKVSRGQKMQIMFVSFRLTNQSCNIYNVK